MAETYYYDVSIQLRRLSQEVVEPLRILRQSGAKEIPPEEIARLIRATREVLQGVSDAYTAFYARLRPSWKPPNPATLPAPFCPLAVAIQHDISHPVQHVQPKQPEFSDCWECTQCSAVTRKCDPDESMAKDWRRVPFAGHLQAQSRNEKVKHACPGCLEVFEDWKQLDSHVFMINWCNWTCGVPPLTLPRYVIGTIVV